MQVSRTGPRPELLARVVGKVDISMVEAALLADKLPVVRRNTADLLFDDELFEAAFDQLEEDDKRLEFRDLIDEQERKRCRAKKALRTMTFAVEQSKRKAPGPLPKRRAKRARLKVQVEAMPSGEAGPHVPEAIAALPPPAGPDVPEADPPPVAAPVEVVGPGEAAAPAAAREEVVGPGAAAPAAARVPRGVPCGPVFIIAGAYRSGSLEAVTCTCKLHTRSGRCNKSLTLGVQFTEEEATLRIKEWCARGLDIADSDKARSEHMAINPRNFRASDVRNAAELDRLVGAVGPLP